MEKNNQDAVGRRRPYDEAFKRDAVRSVGLRGHVHTFRHGSISNALTKGAPEAIVGHVGQEILRHYTHIADAAS